MKNIFLIAYYSNLSLIWLGHLANDISASGMYEKLSSIGNPSNTNHHIYIYWNVSTILCFHSDFGKEERYLNSTGICIFSVFYKYKL